MLRHVGHGDPRLGRKRVHVARRLRKQVDQLQPFVAGQGGTDTGELPVQGLLVDGVWIGQDLTLRPTLQ